MSLKYLKCLASISSYLAVKIQYQYPVHFNIAIKFTRLPWRNRAGVRPTSGTGGIYLSFEIRFTTILLILNSIYESLLDNKNFANHLLSVYATPVTTVYYFKLRKSNVFFLFAFQRRYY